MKLEIWQTKDNAILCNRLGVIKTLTKEQVKNYNTKFIENRTAFTGEKYSVYLVIGE